MIFVTEKFMKVHGKMVQNLFKIEIVIINMMKLRNYLMVENVKMAYLLSTPSPPSHFVIKEMGYGMQKNGLMHLIQLQALYS